MIAAARRIVELCSRAKSGSWHKAMGVELYGKTLGIIGLGRIGSKVAEIARVLEMNVLAYDIADVTERAKKIGVQLVSSLDELLRLSDIVSLHVPLTKETYHMIDYRELELMKNGVIIVNTSRGAVINTRALLDALNRGKVAAAALDVLEHEPPKEPWELELIRHPRVIVTPHIGSQTKEAQERIAYEILKKIGLILKEGA